jgi:DNA (cytosine-5)-methyltransferase 1
MRMNIEHFRDWLVEEIEVSTRSASDVMSRLRRLSELISIDSKSDIADQLHRLSKNESFKLLSPSVRSQLRRSLKLYSRWKIETSGR